MNFIVICKWYINEIIFGFQSTNFAFRKDCYWITLLRQRTSKGSSSLQSSTNFWIYANLFIFSLDWNLKIWCISKWIGFTEKLKTIRRENFWTFYNAVAQRFSPILHSTVVKHLLGTYNPISIFFFFLLQYNSF